MPTDWDPSEWSPSDLAFIAGLAAQGPPWAELYLTKKMTELDQAYADKDQYWKIEHGDLLDMAYSALCIQTEAEADHYMDFKHAYEGRVAVKAGAVSL